MKSNRDPSTLALNDPPPIASLARLRHALSQRVAQVGWLERRCGNDDMVWSSEVYRLLGVRPGESDADAKPSLQQWLDRVHPEDRAAAQSAWRGVEAGTPNHANIQYRLQRTDGVWLKVRESCEHWRAAPDAAAWVLSAIACVGEGTADTSPVRQPAPLQPAGPPADEPRADAAALESTLANDSACAVRELAGSMAHDFNNLLTTILGNCHSLLDELPANGTGRRRLTQIQLAAERGSSLIHKVLAYGGRQMLQPVDLDLAAHVRDLAPQLEQILRPPIALRIEVPNEGTLVRVDPEALDQAILHLVLNARDALSGGGTIALRVQPLQAGHAQTLYADGIGWPPQPAVEAGVVLEVSDDGCGVPEAVARRAFEPFFTTKDAAPGAGLGLSMVQGFARQSGGAVDLRSEPGAGTSVRLFLPAAPDGDRLTAPAPTGSARPRAPQTALGFPVASAPVAPQRVLLVDDDPFVRSYVRELLESDGHSVQDTGNPLDALSIAEQPGCRVDVLITDLIMPELRGDRLAVEIRRAHPDALVLYITGYAGRDHRDRQSLALPGDGLLIKPFSPDDLRHHLEVALRAARD